MTERGKYVRLPLRRCLVCAHELMYGELQPEEIHWDAFIAKEEERLDFCITHLLEYLSWLERRIEEESDPEEFKHLRELVEVIRKEMEARIREAQKIMERIEALEKKLSR